MVSSKVSISLNEIDLCLTLILFFNLEYILSKETVVLDGL